MSSSPLHILDRKKNLSFRKLKEVPISKLWVELKSPDLTYKVLVDNEYGEFNENKPALCLYHVLLAFEDYKVSKDYLEWCRDNDLDAAQLQWLDYYKSMEESTQVLYRRLGFNVHLVSRSDFEFRTSNYTQYLL